MTPLEAARKLASLSELIDVEGTPITDVRVYAICGMPVHHGHDPDCPWIAVPKIVAALEAAERMTTFSDEDGSVVCVGRDDFNALRDALGGD